MRHRIIQTFTGPFAIIENEDGIVSTTWLSAASRRLLAHSSPDKNLQPELTRLVAVYFAGEDVNFSDVPLPHGSPFFRNCWRQCRRIPRGQTVSYGELARRAGSPGASRAAGQAMRNNPLPIIIPCHRVIGSSGHLHGFGGSCDAAGDALGVKAALLKMEGWPGASHFTRASAELAAAV
jgi:methylated-DNA-[protein]-cysteine S-methyltransferase